MEERAEARQALSLLRAVRNAVPACFSASSAQQGPYNELEKDWLAKVNGQSAGSSPSRVRPSRQSKNVVPRAVRTSPAAAMKPKMKSTVSTPAP